MRTIACCISIMLMLLSQETKAASTPLPHSNQYLLPDTGIRNLHVSTPYTPATFEKKGLLRKLQYKLALKHIKRLSTSVSDDRPHQRNVLSTISLILGVIGAVSLFIPAMAGIVLIAGPAALITGIIALGKRYNNSKASRAKAIIGLVLGGILVFLSILALILVAAFFSDGWYG